ncbi:GNAT family N-acetyltransferase [Aquibacillus albus]|uniref:N-acetyltransferase domain-containing protein n=1 Tax=Aquibacillus albus TaxID=1168171 RepID=A0ABS2MYW8_9BACI|nr:N-acetyltransferase [Aquibacillus albus]MBM7571036.1 hypothetical protein [Aquibacillus albus]
MSQNTLQLRKLTIDDFELVQNMNTKVEDDYILHIYPNLVESNTHAMYGLFEQGQLLAIAGYSLFPGGYAMLGRLRSDKSLLSKGNATEILSKIKAELELNPSIKWIGANTNIGNKPARRVLDKIGFHPFTKLYSYPVKDKSLLQGRNGPIWNEVDSIKEKRALLESIKDHSPDGVYPYEIFYPFPFSSDLITDEKLQAATFYQNQTQDRFIVIEQDEKHEKFAQVKYFWDDHFEQPGLWDTAFHYINEQSEPMRAWMDFSEKGYANIPNIDAFEVSDGWVLYGKWVAKE